MTARYNADLANNLGNLVSRVSTVVGSKCGGVGPAPDPESALRTPARDALQGAAEGWASFAPQRALESTWRLIGAANAALEATEPWKQPAGPEVDVVLGDALEVLRIVALLIAPAMPSTARTIWGRLGLSGDVTDRPVMEAAAWGQYPGGLVVERGEPLFPRRRD
jgi:methionyl-tRNA synthetase